MKMSDRFRPFQDLIKDIIFENQFTRKNFFIYTAKILLIDGSNFRISEKYINNKLDKYSYYWLDETNSLIIGWDNAPHHPSVSSFPHHKHFGQQNDIVASEEKNLQSVFKFIQRRLYL